MPSLPCEQVGPTVTGGELWWDLGGWTMILMMLVVLTKQSTPLISRKVCWCMLQYSWYVVPLMVQLSFTIHYMFMYLLCKLFNMCWRANAQASELFNFICLSLSLYFFISLHIWWLWRNPDYFLTIPQPYLSTLQFTCESRPPRSSPGILFVWLMELVSSTILGGRLYVYYHQGFCIRSHFEHLKTCERFPSTKLTDLEPGYVISTDLIADVFSCLPICSCVKLWIFSLCIDPGYDSLDVLIRFHPGPIPHRPFEVFGSCRVSRDLFPRQICIRPFRGCPNVAFVAGVKRPRAERWCRCLSWRHCRLPGCQVGKKKTWLRKSRFQKQMLYLEFFLGSVQASRFGWFWCKSRYHINDRRW